MNSYIVYQYCRFVRKAEVEAATPEEARELAKANDTWSKDEFVEVSGEEVWENVT